MNVSRLTSYIQQNIRSPKSAKSLLTLTYPQVKTFAKLSKNKKGISFFNKYTKTLVETQSLFTQVKPKATYHNVPISSAVIQYFHGKEKAARFYLDNAFDIERRITKDVKNGFIKIELALRSSIDNSNKVLSYKQKMIWFETDGKKFLKHQLTNEKAMDMPGFAGFNTLKSITNFFDNPINSKTHKPISTMEEARELFLKFHGKSKNIEKSSPFRKEIANELAYPGAKISSLSSANLGLKQPVNAIKYPQKFSGQSVGLKDELGNLLETHNIFNNTQNPNYHGIPYNQSVSVFYPEGNKTRTFLDSHLLIDRAVDMDKKTGTQTIRTVLFEVVNEAPIILSQLLQKSKFEMKNGKPIRLLSKVNKAADADNYKGFAHNLAPGTKAIAKFMIPPKLEEYNAMIAMKNLTHNDKVKRHNPKFYDQLAIDINKAVQAFFKPS